MSDIIDGGPFLGITDVTEVVSAAAQLEINAKIDEVIVALTGQTAASQEKLPSPDFERIHPYTATLIITELEGLKSAIDAAPTA